jgi:hypothetical protein
MLEWARSTFHKKRGGTRYAELLFSHLVRWAVHVVHSGASGARNVIALFFMLRWDRYGFDKNHAETCYAEIVFLHLVVSVEHVVHSGVSGARNVIALFFMLGCDRPDSTKSAPGHVTQNLCFCIRRDQRVTLSIPVGPGCEISMHYIHARVDQVWFP